MESENDDFVREYRVAGLASVEQRWKVNHAFGKLWR
jgi:hypothetical protein